MEAIRELDIDGAHGEGGGQLLRMAVALSVLTSTPVHLTHIRAGRPKPGLAAQHLTAVRALAEVCGAEVEGLVLGSRDIRFRPGRVRPGDYRFDVGTAGSVALVLQALLPVAVAARTPFSFSIRGGTDVEGAPPLDYLRLVLLPLLARLGARVEIECLRRGYYPKGGGEVRVSVPANGPLSPVDLSRRGALLAVVGEAHAAHLPEHVAARMVRAATAVLGEALPTAPVIRQTVLPAESTLGPGGAIVLAAECEHTRLGASALARRGVPAERLGEEAARELVAAIASGATLDVHAADQLPIYCALAGGVSRFRVQRLSLHAETVLWLLGQFFPLRVDVREEGGLVTVELARRP